MGRIEDYQYEAVKKRSQIQKTTFFRPADVVEVLGCSYLEACKVISNLVDFGVVFSVDMSNKQIYGYTYKFKQM